MYKDNKIYKSKVRGYFFFHNDREYFFSTLKEAKAMHTAMNGEFVRREMNLITRVQFGDPR